MDVAEARRDDAPDAEFVQRVDRAFTRRAAAPVAVGDDDLRTPERLAVEDVIFFRAVSVEAAVVKQNLRVFRPALAPC